MIGADRPDPRPSAGARTVWTMQSVCEPLCTYEIPEAIADWEFFTVADRGRAIEPPAPSSMTRARVTLSCGRWAAPERLRLGRRVENDGLASAFAAAYGLIRSMGYTGICLLTG